MRELIARQRQFLIYLSGGVLCALCDIAIMQLLIMRGINYVIATSIGFVCGLLINYTFHSKLTFQRSASAFSFARYLCVVGINYLFTLSCVSLSMALLGDALAGKLVSLPIIAIIGFLLGKYWIFK